ncbi:MAG: hypothetical protein ACREQB_12360, partial [Candidatus Binataceae bacterium]
YDLPIEVAAGDGLLVALIARQTFAGSGSHAVAATGAAALASPAAAFCEPHDATINAIPKAAIAASIRDHMVVPPVALTRREINDRSAARM